MVSKTGEIHDEKVSRLYRSEDASLLRNGAISINADELMFGTFAESKAELQKIVQRFGYVRKWSWVQSLLNNESFVNSMLNDISKLALRDLDCMMKLAVGFRGVDLKPNEFEVEAYEPDGKSRELVTGRYDHNEKKCSINLGLFTKIFLEPKARQPTNINEKQLAEFLEGIYSTIVHEGFHSVQNSILGDKKRIKNRGNSADNISNFVEGGARFIETITGSFINDWKRASLNDGNSLEKAFLWHFELEPVSSAVNEKPDKIREMLENFKPHTAGMFIFAVRYIANGSFIRTLKEICEMAEQGIISNDDLYSMLDKDIENGTLEKMKQKIIELWDIPNMLK